MVFLCEKGLARHVFPLFSAYLRQNVTILTISFSTLTLEEFHTLK